MRSQSEAIIIQTTVDSEETAEQISTVLLDSRVAACVQVVGPCLSRYRWKGEIETATEHIMIIKTTASAYDQVKSLILQHHNYDVPEIIVLPITAGHPPYLTWLNHEVSD